MTLVSVIVYFHDNLEKLRLAVISISSQRLDNIPVTFEIIIYNDSRLQPSDLRAAIEKLIPPAYPLLVVNNKYKLGICSNRSSVLEVSSGSYIAFLSSNDTWEPMKTFFQYKHIARGSNFVSSAYAIAGTKTIISPPSHFSGFKSIFYSLSTVGTSTVIVSKSLLASQPSTFLWFSQDLALYSQLLRNSDCCYVSVALVLAQSCRISGRSSKSSFVDLLVSFYKASTLSGLNKLEACLASLLYLIRAFRNKIMLPSLEALTLHLDDLVEHLGWLRYCAKIFFYITQSLSFDLFHRSNTCRRRKFGPQYRSFNTSDVYYVAVNSDVFLDAVNKCYQFIIAMDTSPSSFQFVDLGVGKGKSLMILLLNFIGYHSRYPALGVDISQSLLDEAYSNIQSVLPGSPVKLINADASRCSDYVESENIILYAYNPFGSGVLERVIKGLNPSSQIVFIYIEPVHSCTLYNLGFTQIYHRRRRLLETKSREYALFYRPPLFSTSY